MTDDLLVPHDLTELSDAALGRVRALGTSFGRVHVAHVLPRLDPTFPGWVWPRDEDTLRVEHAERTLRSRLRDTGFGHATVHVRLGEPATRIVELASDLAVAMIVIPSHSRRGLHRLLMGSVAEHVARFAPCPVLILPASVMPGVVQPVAVSPDDDRTPEDQVDALACAIGHAVAGRTGFLTAARIAIPVGRGVDWWEEALVRRLANEGIEFVDLVFTVGSAGRAEILALRFEDRFV